MSAFEDEADRMRARDDEAESEMHADMRRDRLADFAPASNVDPLDEDRDMRAREQGFSDAADRAIAIYKAADDKSTLAAGLGTDLGELLAIGRAHFSDSHANYPGANLPELISMSLGDAFLLGVLIGRELPKL